MIPLYYPPNHLQTRHKNLLKLIWSFRQGHQGSSLECVFCHKVKELGDMTVHHNDGEEGHNDFANLSPACYQCNRHEGWVVRRRKKAQMVEREIILPPKDATAQLRELVDYSQGSPEMQANDGAEVEFGRWLWAKVTLLKRVRKSEAINGGAYQTGVSPQATRRYLDKLASDEGPYRQSKDAHTKIKYVVFKPDPTQPIEQSSE